jgi:16S rRNA (uracil1498-N3)-methyltransferase
MTRRLFVPAEKWIGSRALVEGEPHRHLARVLRARPGDKLTLFDGRGGEADAEVLAIERGRTTLSLGARRQVAAPAGPRVVLLQSLARGEKMDFIVQKTTELGVHQIVPVAAGRSVARLSAAEAGPRRARWEKIAQEAARQCGRADVPAIADPRPLSEAIAHAGDDRDHLRLALWEGSRGRPLRAALAGHPSTPPTVTLLVGPEGGFADEEIAAAAQSGFEIVGLGPRILRVETAAVVAVALVQFATGSLD